MNSLLFCFQFSQRRFLGLLFGSLPFSGFFSFRSLPKASLSDSNYSWHCHDGNSAKFYDWYEFKPHSLNLTVFIIVEFIWWTSYPDRHCVPGRCKVCIANPTARYINSVCLCDIQCVIYSQCCVYRTSSDSKTKDIKQKVVCTPPQAEPSVFLPKHKLYTFTLFY